MIERAMIGLVLAGCEQSPPPPIDVAPDRAPTAIAPIEEPPPTAPVEVERVTHLAWSEDGARLAAWCPDCNDERADAIHVVALEPARVEGSYEAGGRSTSHVAWSPDGSRLVASGYDWLRGWKTASHELVLETGSIAMYGAFSFNPAGDRLVWGNVFGTVALVDPADGRELRTAQLHPGAASLGWSHTWSPGGSRLVVSLEHSSPEIWDGRSGARLVKVSAGSHAHGSDEIAWLPGGRRFVLATGSGFVGVVDGTGAVVATLRHGAAISPLAPPELVRMSLSHDQKTLALLSSDGTLRVIDVATGSTATPLTSIGSHAFGGELAFSPDDRQIAAKRDDGIHLVELATSAATTLVTGPYDRLIGWLGKELFVYQHHGELVGFVGTRARWRCLSDDDWSVTLGPDKIAFTANDAIHLLSEGREHALRLERAGDVVRARSISATLCRAQ